MSARIYLRFAEGEANVAPSDDAGQLADLGITTGLSLPAVVASYTGRGRQFAATTGFVAADAPSGNTLLPRDCSVQALLTWAPATQGATPGTIICRGIDGSASEYYAFGLELRRIAGQVGELRWFWADAAGALRTQVGGHVQWPATP